MIRIMGVFSPSPPMSVYEERNHTECKIGILAYPYPNFM